MASVGLDQYAFGFLFNVDVRVDQIAGTGPTIIALVFGAGKTWPLMPARSNAVRKRRRR